jgi:UDP-N-acetylmuramate--alanine ligase
MDEFAESLCLADEIIVTAIYKSREDPLPGVSAATIVEKIERRGHGGARYVEKKESIAPRLLPLLREGDGVIVMGAGDIWEVGQQLAAGIHDA